MKNVLDWNTKINVTAVRDEENFIIKHYIDSLMISGYLEKPCKYQLVKTLDEGDDFYGLGDKSGFLNKKHYEYENWDYDKFKELSKDKIILIDLKEKFKDKMVDKDDVCYWSL